MDSKNVPLYEIYYSSIKSPSLIDIIAYKLYKKNNDGRFDKLLYWLDSIKFLFKDKSEKLVESNPIDIETLGKDDVYNHTTAVHRTKPFNTYEVQLTDGYKIRCADTHLLYASSGYVDGWVSANRLTPDHYILCDDGNWHQVINVVFIGDKSYMGDVTVDSPMHEYYTNGILSHNTTTTASYLVWQLLFHADKNILVTANKGKTGTEILMKIKEILEGLPFFLKPGIVNLRTDRMKFENGSSIKTTAASKTPATGDSIQILYIDEAAHIPSNIIDDYWASVEPTMSSFRGAQIIVSSTPKGKGNLFHRLYTEAVPWDSPDVDIAIKNKKFIRSRVDWWEVPGRDEMWEKSQRQDLGDEIFNREYGLSFESMATRLISGWYMKLMHKIQQQFNPIDFYKVPESISQKIIWHPDFKPDTLTYYELLNMRVLLTIDTAQGNEKAAANSTWDSDYNIINIFLVQLLSPSKIQENRLRSKPINISDVIQYKQVGIYMDNTKDEEECAEAAKYITFNIFKSGFKDIDNVRILIELNFNGSNWITKFKTHPSYYDQLIIRTAHGVKADEKTKLQYGFKTTKGSNGKNYYCEQGAKLMDKRQILISQWAPDENRSSVTQLEQFGKNEKGKYECSACHDDIAVSSVFICIAHEQPLFRIWIEEWLEQLEPEPKVQIIRRMLELYVEEETEVSDEQFSNFFNTVSAGFGKLTKPINSYSTRIQQAQPSQNTGTFGRQPNMGQSLGTNYGLPYNLGMVQIKNY